MNCQATQGNLQVVAYPFLAENLAKAGAIAVLPILRSRYCIEHWPYVI